MDLRTEKRVFGLFLVFFSSFQFGHGKRIGQSIVQGCYFKIDHPDSYNIIFEYRAAPCSLQKFEQRLLGITFDVWTKATEQFKFCLPLPIRSVL